MYKYYTLYGAHHNAWSIFITFCHNARRPSTFKERIQFRLASPNGFFPKNIHTSTITHKASHFKKFMTSL